MTTLYKDIQKSICSYRKAHYTCKNCNICRGIITKVTTKQFIAEVALLSTDISIIHGEYVNANTKLNVSCKEGHTWAITPSYLKSRLTNSKCPICSNSFLNKLKEIDSTLVSPIVSSRLRHTITCKEGHIREVIPTHLVTHSTGAICRICNPISKPEQGLLGFIRSKYTGWIETSDKSILEGKELDIVLPDLGLAIEFNGDYWHSDKFRDKEYHLDKTNRVQDFGYQLIHINESEWDNKQDIVKSRIQSLLGDSYKIYAKKTLIRRIDFPKEFLETNHIQGSGSNSSYNYGLFLKDELIAVMTFSIPRFSKGYDYELIRYCSLLDITVVGGASKLLKAFIKDMPNKTIISYSDKRWSKGNLYKVLGFILDHTSTPNYRYIKGTI